MFPEAKITPGSGSKNVPGDITSKDIYVEVKSTEKKSYSLSKETIQSIIDEAATKKLWILNIRFMENNKTIRNLAVIDMETLKNLLKE